MVIKITYRGKSFLFPGDSERKEERELMESGVDLSADVLHAPHHGAEESNEYRFVREVSPDYAIISVGKNNGYNHPDEKAMSVLIQATGNRENVMRTDERGTIACYTDGSSIIFGKEAEERIVSMLNNAGK